MGLCPFTHPSSAASVLLLIPAQLPPAQPGLALRGAPAGGLCQLSFTEIQLVCTFCYVRYFCRKWHHFRSTSFGFFPLISWELETLEYGRQVLSISTHVFMTFSAKVTSTLSLRFPRVYEREKWSCSVVSNSLQPHELYSPWSSPGQNTGVGSLSLLQGIFPTWGSNPGLPRCRRILYQLSHKGSPCL